MKTVVCRKTGNTKSISVNTSYTTISETEKRYTLVNDKGIQANYCKSLFTEEPVATQTRAPRAPRVAPVPVVPEPVAVPNTQINEVNVTVSVNYDSSDEEYTVNLTASAENNFNVNNRITLSQSDTVISCGIVQLTSLDTLCQTITTFKRNIFTHLNTLQNTDVNVSENDIDTSDILEGVINELVENADDTIGLLLLSTNTNSALTTPTYREVLDRMSATTVETLNPNSGNRIKLWTLQITE